MTTPTPHNDRRIDNTSTDAHVAVELEDSDTRDTAATKKTVEKPSTKTSPTSRRRPIRRAFRWLLLITAGLWGAIVAITSSAWGQERARDLLENVLRSELGLNAEISDLDVGWDLFPPSVVARASAVTIEHPEEGPLLSASSLSIRPPLLSFILGSPDLGDITIEAPSITLLLRDGAIVNLPEIPESSDEASPLESLPLSSVRVSDAEFLLITDVNLELRLGPMDASAAINGPRIDLDLNSDAGGVRFENTTENIESLIVRGALILGADGPDVELETFEIHTPFLRTGLSDASGSLSNQNSWGSDVELEVDLRHLSSLPLGIGVPLAGRVLIRGEVGFGEDGRPEGAGEIRIVDGQIDRTWGLGDEIVLLIEGDEEGLRILDGSEALLIGGGGRIGLLGEIEFDPAAGFPIQIETDLDIQFAKLIEQLGVTPNTPIWWPIRGSGELRGTLLPLDISGPLSIFTDEFIVTLDPYHQRPRERIITARNTRIRGSWHVTEQAFRFERITLQSERTTAQAPLVHLGFDNAFVAEVSGIFDAADVSPLTDFELAGRGPATVSIGGTLTTPTVSGHLDFEGFEFDGIRAGDIESDWALTEDYLGVVFPLVRGEKGQSTFEAHDLHLDFSEHIEVTTRIDARRLHLQDLYHVFGFENDERYTPYQGVARGEVDVRFTHGFPSDGPNGTVLLDVDARLLGADLAGITFDHGSVGASLRWFDMTGGLDAADLSIEHAVLHKGQGTLNVAGTINRSDLHLSLLLDQFSFRETEGIGDTFEQLSGGYGVIGRVRGTVDIPRLDLEVAMSDIAWEGEYLGNARAQVRLTDQRDPWLQDETENCHAGRRALVNADWEPGPPLQTRDGIEPARQEPMAFIVCGEGLGGELAVDMALGWTDVYPARGNIHMREMNLAAFMPDGGRGTFSGEVHLEEGALKEEASFGGTLVGTALDAQAAGLTFFNRGDMEFRIERGGLEVERAEIGTPGGNIALRGGIDGMGVLDVGVDGSVDLSTLNLIDAGDVSDVGGGVRFSVNTTGTLDDPNMTGEAELVSIGASITDPDVTLRNLRGRVTFDERRLELEGIEGELAGGRLSLTGGATVSANGLQSFSVTARLDGASLSPEDGVDIAANVNTTVTWEDGDRLPHMTGLIDLQEVNYRRPIQLSPTLGELYRPERDEVERYDPAEDLVSFDLQLTASTPIHLRNNLADLYIDIDDSERAFRVVGTDQRWGVVGTLNIPRGIVRFRSTELDVTEGEVRFDDPTQLDPQFSVLAVTEIRRQQASSDLTGQLWRVELHAHGDMEGINLDADSSPPLSDEDLMLLLTVGMTSAEAQQLQAGDVGGTALEALSAISGVNEEVVSALGVIDEFAITTQYSPDTGRPEPFVTIGTRITERVRLSAATGLAAESRTFQSAVEWQLGDQTSIRAIYDNINRESASNLGNLGLDLHWRLEFD